ncbi:MAG: hypothetical protein JWS12_986 [Candidatus Saccharibacteria bacterium]|nr:hypothetical protein [Candidatus Saccharibacteria bacterium]
MELQYYGANCLRIVTKKANVVIDDNLSDLGAKSIAKNEDILLFTGTHGLPHVEPKLVIDQPGEYEASDISINGIAARAHMDEEGQQTATMFRLVVDDIRIVFLGHIYPELNDDQLEALGTVDILVVPVGGSGYTLDAIGALKLIKKIEPKLIIPVHYAEEGINYPVPQQELDVVLKELSMEPKERLPKLKLKGGELGELTELIVLEKQ